MSRWSCCTAASPRCIAASNATSPCCTAASNAASPCCTAASPCSNAALSLRAERAAAGREAAVADGLNGTATEAALRVDKHTPGCTGGWLTGSPATEAALPQLTPPGGAKGPTGA